MLPMMAVEQDSLPQVMPSQISMAPSAGRGADVALLAPGEPQAAVEVAAPAATTPPHDTQHDAFRRGILRPAFRVRPEYFLMAHSRRAAPLSSRRQQARFAARITTDFRYDDGEIVHSWRGKADRRHGAATCRASSTGMTDGVRSPRHDAIDFRSDGYRNAAASCVDGNRDAAREAPDMIKLVPLPSSAPCRAKPMAIARCSAPMVTGSGDDTVRRRWGLLRRSSHARRHEGYMIRPRRCFSNNQLEIIIELRAARGTRRRGISPPTWPLEAAARPPALEIIESQAGRAVAALNPSPRSAEPAPECRKHSRRGAGWRPSSGRLAVLYIMSDGV